MFEISEIQNERLKQMPFLDYLKAMQETIENITHIKKSDNAYSRAREYAMHVINRYISEYNLSWDNYYREHAGQHLRLSYKLLDMYSSKSSDKQKEYRLNEFVHEFTYDLQSMIFARERHKQNPDSPIEDEPI